MIRRPPRSTQSRSSAASDVYKRQVAHERGCVPRKTASRLWSLRSKFLFALLLAALSPLAVYAYLSFTATSAALERHERLAMANRSQAVQAALEARGQAVVDQVVSFGEWTPFARAIDQRDLAWLRENVTAWAVSYTHLRAHETRHDLVCRLLLEKK